MDWEKIMSDAEVIKNKLLLLNVDLSEAQKLGSYFNYNKYDERSLNRYLRTMAENPPPRSKITQRHYRGLQQIWREWKTELQGKEKAIAWGWGVKMAHAGKR